MADPSINLWWYAIQTSTFYTVVWYSHLDDIIYNDLIMGMIIATADVITSQRFCI